MSLSSGSKYQDRIVTYNRKTELIEHFATLNVNADELRWQMAMLITLIEFWWLISDWIECRYEDINVTCTCELWFCQDVHRINLCNQSLIRIGKTFITKTLTVAYGSTYKRKLVRRHAQWHLVLYNVNNLYSLEELPWKLLSSSLIIQKT